MDKDLEKLVIAHMMRSTSERYALLLKVGVEYRYLAQFNLDASPRLIASQLCGPQNGIIDWMGKEAGSVVFEALKVEPLPEGIVLPLN